MGRNQSSPVIPPALPYLAPPPNAGHPPPPLVLLVRHRVLGIDREDLLPPGVGRRGADQPLTPSPNRYSRACSGGLRHFGGRVADGLVLTMRSNPKERAKYTASRQQRYIA